MADWIARLPMDLIKEKADFYGVTPNLVAAIIQQESGGNTYAMRYEPEWAYFHQVDYMANLCGSSRDTEKIAQMTSWGLMQTMGSVCRELGWNGWLSELVKPDVGIEFGSKKLALLMKQYGRIDAAASAYNAGSVRFTESGYYVNQTYVDSVMGFYQQL